VKKKDNSLRLCVDYRPLNAVKKQISSTPHWHSIWSVSRSSSIL
jgi:hypothetical protein